MREDGGGGGEGGWREKNERMREREGKVEKER